MKTRKIKPATKFIQRCCWLNLRKSCWFSLWQCSDLWKVCGPKWKEGSFDTLLHYFALTGGMRTPMRSRTFSNSSTFENPLVKMSAFCSAVGTFSRQISPLVTTSFNQEMETRWVLERWRSVVLLPFSIAWIAAKLSSCLRIKHPSKTDLQGTKTAQCRRNLVMAVTGF